MKSGFDIACWDILGQVAGLRCAKCWAGDMGTISRSTGDFAGSAGADGQRVAEYRAEGYHKFQHQSRRRRALDDIARIKRSRRCCNRRRLIADANTGWLMHDAIRVAERRPRSRRLHRAAHADVRGMPERTAEDFAAVRDR